MKVQFVSTESIEKRYEVESYFPMRSNCRVVLYQETHCPLLPHLETVISESRNCWMDIRRSLLDAQKLICITGWSVWHELHLLRGEEEGRYAQNVRKV